MPLFPFFRGEGLFRGKRQRLRLCNEMLLVTSCCARLQASSRKTISIILVPEVGDVQTWKPLSCPNDFPAFRSPAWQQSETQQKTSRDMNLMWET